MRTTGRYWWMTVFMAGLTVISSFAMTRFKVDSPEWLLWIAIIPNGFGASGVITSTLIALIGSVKVEDMAVATGSRLLGSSSFECLCAELTVICSVSYMFRTTGQVVGVGITSSISQSVLTQRLTERLKGDDAGEVCRVEIACASSETDSGLR